MQTAPTNRVFVSYSHKDAAWLERLNVHLRPLVRSGMVDLWDDTKIVPGRDWRLEIQEAIESASVAVLLVSADFLASEFVTRDEIPRLLSTAAERGTLIVSVILGPSMYEQTPEISRFQAINPPSNPLCDMNWGDAERTFKRLAETVARRFVRGNPPGVRTDRMPAGGVGRPPPPAGRQPEQRLPDRAEPHSADVSFSAPKPNAQKTPSPAVPGTQGQEIPGSTPSGRPKPDEHGLASGRVATDGGPGRPAPHTTKEPPRPGSTIGLKPPTRVSAGWWYMAVLLGWLGGIAAWSANKKENPKKARSMLLVGIVSTAVETVAAMVVWFLLTRSSSSG